MDCGEFQGHWPRYLSSGADAATTALLEQHAGTCEACRATWRGHQKLKDDMAGAISVASADELSEAVVQDLRPPTWRPVNQAGVVVGAAAMASTSIGFLAIGMLLGFVLNSEVSGISARNDVTTVQQIALIRALNGRRGRQSAPVPTAIRILPELTRASKSLVLVCVVIWAARTRLWELKFPGRVPFSLRFARRAVLAFALLGLAQFGLTFMLITESLVRDPRVGGYPNGADLAWHVPFQTAAHELWSLSFWIVVLALAYSFVQVLHQQATQSPRDYMPASQRP